MTVTVPVGIVSRTFFNMPYWIAIRNGFFADEGISATTTIYGNASQVPPLMDGSLRIVLGTPEGALLDAAAGGPVRLIAGNTGKLTHSLLARGPFRSIQHLKGATIGILNTTEGTFFQIKEMLARHGLHYPGDYKVKETGGVPARHKALLDGSIDAGLQSIPWNYVGEDVGLNKLGDIIDYVPDWQFVSINANSNWTTGNKDFVVSFLRAICRATDWFYANPEASAQIAAEELPAPIEHARRAWQHYTSTNALTRGVSINTAGLTKVLTTLRVAELLPATASLDHSQYVIDEYLDTARRSLSA
jgi:ABC-type nitrate/sulfonate/bicarbonate transport system substrate-binding protein